MLKMKMSRPAGFLAPDLLKWAFGMLLLGTGLCGCVGGPHAASSDAAPLFTGSIPVATAQIGGTTDRAIVEAAVTAIPLPDASKGIPWANASTGTNGVISKIAEVRTGGNLCRKFETSRHGYDGIALYFGLACRADGGGWRLIEFHPKRKSDTIESPTPAVPATG